MNSRELVFKTLNFQKPERAPRQLWVLPWAKNNYSEKIDIIAEDFPNDIVSAPGFNSVLPKTQGNPYEIGTFIDDWGCNFANVQRGIIGEIKEPLIKGEDFEDIHALRIPVENLSIDVDKVNKFCKYTDKFVLASACPRPFERLQFIRGTEQLYVDLRWVYP